MMSVEDILIQHGDNTVKKNTTTANPNSPALTPEPTISPEQQATLNSQKPSPSAKIINEGNLTKEQRETFLFWKEVGLAVLWVIFLVLSTVAVTKKLRNSKAAE